MAVFSVVFTHWRSRMLRLAALLGVVVACVMALGACHSGDDASKPSAYLFTYFTGNGPHAEAIRFGVSTDGYHYRALNNNEPVLDNKDISKTGGVRDPHILRCQDGHSFYMVATDLYTTDMGWNNFAMILMKSNDLVHWTSAVVNIPEAFPDEYADVHRVWAPQTIYDSAQDKYMVYFSMKQGDDPDKIYYAYANKEFTALESAPKQLYYPPKESNNKACIDGDIIPFNGKYYLFHKAEDGDPGIKLAISDKLTEGYKLVSNDRVDSETTPVEGSGVFKLNGTNEWILMYDLYSRGGYQFTKSTDLEHFTVIDEQVSMNFHPRHGTILPITSAELKTLIETWAVPEDPLIDASSDALKKQNVAMHADTKVIELPVKLGTDLAHFDPAFTTFPGVSVTPEGPQDFSKGPVAYTIKVYDKEPVTWQVAVSEDHNPIVEGFYADPDIMYSEKTGKFYLYPTSDGFTDWAGNYFETFSSDDLVHWKNEGKILDLKTDVSWTDRNAWAPCIMERKEGDAYKYYYYFCAAQRIGVATADDPAGPFTDSGKPMIDWRPEGIKGGQEIDPDVFLDPESGKYYLYWGNGYMAAAELNDDMMSIKRETLKVLTPDNTYREGTNVFYRDGTYYFLWSEDDTRSPNYKVRYATAKTPLGPLTIPENNIVIARNDEEGILATGHNSILQIPGRDEWYIVYHRFTYPKGEGMGRSAGYHREVCIDAMSFDEDGHIIQVVATKKGIAPVSLNK